MFCGNCGAEVSSQNNFCPYCGNRLGNTSVASSLMNKAAYTAQSKNHYNLVLVSRGNCDAVTAGDLLEDVFGYTDAESGNLVSMAPVVVGENLTADEAATVAQMYTEYGMQVSITDDNDQYVDLCSKAVNSVFDLGGNLLSSAAAVISSLTVANRIRSYRRFKKPSLLERLFRIDYKPARPATHHRNFRPTLDPRPVEPRKTIRRPMAAHPAPGGMQRPTMGTGAHSSRPAMGNGVNANRPNALQDRPGQHDPHGPGNHGGPNGGRR